MTYNIYNNPAEAIADVSTDASHLHLAAGTL